MSQLTRLADWQMMPDERQVFWSTMRDELFDDWEKYHRRQTEARTDKEREEIEAAVEKERKDFDKQLESLAKALPNVTKGVLNAVTAFQRNDPFTGSAAVMDICASVAPLIAGLSAAGGPPGMVVGAIFSMIGQILSFDNEQKIGAVHDDIRVYTIGLRKAILRANGALEDSKATTKAFAEDFATQAGVLANLVNSLDPGAIRGLWEVARWLREEKNQGEDKWPLVLAAWCEAYSDLLFTAAMARVLANTDGMRKRFEDAGSLPQKDQDKLEKLNETLPQFADIFKS